jgi:hypothetical protein
MNISSEFANYLDRMTGAFSETLNTTPVSSRKNSAALFHVFLLAGSLKLNPP